MNKVYCLIANGRVEIYLKGVAPLFNRMIGTVVQIGEGEPVITLFAHVEPIELTFNDMAIILDNWNQCEEMNQLSR
jgi:hypothetical protein